VSNPIFDAQRAERIKLLSDAINKNGVSITDNTRLSDDEIAEIERAAYAKTWGKANDDLGDAVQRLKDTIWDEIEKLARRLRLL